jgi:hypothetical protein
MPSSEMLRRMVHVRTDVSEGRIASIVMVERISELGTTLTVRRYVPQKLRFLQEPHGVTSQKTAFFIVTAVKTFHRLFHIHHQRIVQ